MKSEDILEMHEAYVAWTKEFDFIADMTKGMDLFQKRLIEELEDRIAWIVKNLDFIKSNKEQTKESKALMDAYAQELLSNKMFLYLVRTIKPKVHEQATKEEAGERAQG